MSESQQDQGANTARFRAFVEEADDAPRSARSRGLLIGGVVVAVVVVVVILAVAL